MPTQHGEHVTAKDDGPDPDDNSHGDGGCYQCPIRYRPLEDDAPRGMNLFLFLLEQEPFVPSRRWALLAVARAEWLTNREQGP